MEKKILTIALSIIFLIALMAISVSATTTNSAKNTYNATCMQNAVMVRETAIASAYQTMITELMVSFQNRSASLIAAYGLNDSKQRNVAVKNAWKVYTDSYRASSKELNDARNLAWKNFNTDKLLCKDKESIESSSNEIRL